MGVHWKIRFFRRGGGHQKPIYREELPEKGGGGLAKKRGWLVLLRGGGDGIQMQTVWGRLVCWIRAGGGLSAAKGGHCLKYLKMGWNRGERK